jgi:Uma2 family endonuclease
MSLASKLVVAEEFFELPDDGLRRELIEGQIHIMSPASYRHGYVEHNLSGEIYIYSKKHRTGQGFDGDTGFLIARNPDTVLAPDCAYVRRERIKDVERRRGFCGAYPDLAAEVISPSETKQEVSEKVNRWIAAGVEVVWVIDPELRQATIYEGGSVKTVGEDDLLTAESLMPGFSVRLGDLFELTI